MSYALQVDLLERRAATAQVVAAVALSVGAKDVTMPDPDEWRARFDAGLDAEPRRVAVDELALRRRLRIV